MDNSTSSIIKLLGGHDLLGAIEAQEPIEFAPDSAEVLDAGVAREHLDRLGSPDVLASQRGDLADILRRGHLEPVNLLRETQLDLITDVSVALQDDGPQHRFVGGHRNAFSVVSPS